MGCPKPSSNAKLAWIFFFTQLFNQIDICLRRASMIIWRRRGSSFLGKYILSSSVLVEPLRDAHCTGWVPKTQSPNSKPAWLRLPSRSIIVWKIFGIKIPICNISLFFVSHLPPLEQRQVGENSSRGVAIPSQTFLLSHITFSIPIPKNNSS